MRPPFVTGWHDQIRAVLCDAQIPLSTRVIAERARIVGTGRFADPDLAKRRAGDIGQEGYRYLRALERSGLAARSYCAGDTAVFWMATAALRKACDGGLAELEAAWALPVRTRRPKPRRRRKPNA